MKPYLYQLVRCITLFGLFSTVIACQTKEVLILASINAVDSADKSCKPLKSTGSQMEVAIDSTGKFCLVQNLVQRNMWSVSEGRDFGKPKDGVVIFFDRAHDVEADLRGHLVTGEPFENVIGVRARERTSLIKIRNGFIRTPGRHGVGVLMAHHKNPGRFATEPGPEDLPPIDPRSLNVPWNYLPPTQYTAENLQIESGGRGAIMSGTGNVLRNNIIEVESATAAYLYGPGSVIEGNTFIVHQTKGEPAATLAILKLRDAHGTVIRNNRFIVKGVFAGKAEAAINLLESKDVVIEGNTIEGAKVLVRKDAASTTVEKGNEVK
jgi:hypothetical protein